MTIFISYSHKDADYAHLLAKKLEEEGFLVWIDNRIEYSTSWPPEIQKELDECSAFIVIMTSDSYSSKWVRKELIRALEKDKTIFPLLLEGDRWLLVQDIQFVDVRGRKLPPPEFYDKLAKVALGVIYPPAPSFPEELQPAGPTDGRQPRKQDVRDLIVEAGKCDDFSEKRNILMKVIQLDPDDPIGYRLLAWTCQRLEDYSSAIEYDRQAMNLDPSYAKAYVGLIIAGDRTGNYSLVDENWSKLCEICGEKERPFHEGAYWFADSLESRGNYTNAKRWFGHVTGGWWRPANKYENWLLGDAKSKVQRL